MALYDSSILIGCLEGEDAAVELVKKHSDETAITVLLIMFEVYQGEVFSPGEPDFDGLESALGWLEVIDEKPAYAREAAELQEEMSLSGNPLSVRDVYVAGAASATGEKLMTTDSNLDDDVLRDAVGVELV